MAKRKKLKIEQRDTTKLTGWTRVFRKGK